MISISLNFFTPFLPKGNFSLFRRELLRSILNFMAKGRYAAPGPAHLAAVPGPIASGDLRSHLSLRAAINRRSSIC
jgi:hypothetical protein